MAFFLRPKRPVMLHAFARSRRNPVRHSVAQIGKWRLIWAEYVGWRLSPRQAPPDQALQRALPVLLAELALLDDAALDARIANSRPKAEAIRTPQGFAAFAEALEVMRRATGFALRQNQIACAASLLAGECVELRTGEGKTLAAGLAAVVAARAGVSGHVVTVNDYLAQRDHDLMAPIAARFGFGQLDFGSPQIKTASYCYLGAAAGAMSLNIAALLGGQPADYDYPARGHGESMRELRFDLGRGLRSTYLTPTFSNVDGAPFTVDAVRFVINESTRRI